MLAALSPTVVAAQDQVSPTTSPPPASPAPTNATPTGQRLSITADHLLALADRSRAAGDLAFAENAYLALFDDPSVKVRSEARFRLAMLFVSQRRPRDAGVLLRQILDEQPDAQRVRLELARVLDMLGDEGGARRALREAQAGGLPPEVARFVDRYSAALRSKKPFGASIELALAPDSNINRATRSSTLGTVIGDFTLDDDAREKSGLGAAIRGQAYVRHDIGKQVSLLARTGVAADIYREGAFNDISWSVTGGPETRMGRDRLTIEAGTILRWFGGDPYSTTATLGANYFHPIDRQSQLRLIASAGAIDNKRNRLQDGQAYALSLNYERALTASAGIGVSICGDRQDLRDAGYAATSGQFTLLGYADIGATTLVATASYARLEADARQFIYPRRRVDDLVRVSLGATFRQLAVGEFAPFIRMICERNHSTIEIFDYRRIRAELGITRAF